MTPGDIDVRGLARPAASGTAGGALGASTPTIPLPRKRWRTRILLPSLILLAWGALFIATSWETLLPATEVRVVPVVLKSFASVSAGAFTVQAAGWVEPDPFPIYVSALTSGTVAEVLALEGQTIEAGEIVARLVPDDARLELDRAEAEMGVARAERENARAGKDAAAAVRETLVARALALESARGLVDERAGEVEEKTAAARAEEALLAELEDEHSRKSRLAGEGAVSAGEIARLALRVEAKRAALAEARAAVKTASGKFAQAEAALKAAESDSKLLIAETQELAAATARLESAEAALRLAEARRDEAALRLARTEVRAPARGIVMERLVSPGSQVLLDAGEFQAHILHLYDPDQLQVRVDIPLADAAAVQLGQEAEIIVEVLPESRIHGKVARMVHQANIQKNTVQVKVAIENPATELKPEMLARVRFRATAQAGDAAQRIRVLAPARLLHRDGGGAGNATALVATALRDGRGRAERRQVTLGADAGGGWVEVLEGLQGGDQLIDAEGFGVTAGDRILVVGEASGDGAEGGR
ncbi:MAG: efflux RND transporter periplasmic adaptor subunit [Planctomycetes bacterium]|nr:efflux RND transporter periplasmic adaptor subunit [Planctomycetota bacterium]